MINTIERTNCPILKSRILLKMIEKNTDTTDTANKVNKGITIFSFIMSFKEGTAFFPISLLYLKVHHKNGTILYKYPVMLRTIQSIK
jgi:hypothetical protein